MTGFVAAHLAASLEGAEPYGTSLGTTPPSWLDAGRYRAADLSSDDVRDVVRWSRPDVVFHLAAQASAARSWEDPFGTLDANVVGTARLLDAIAREAPEARVVVAGTGDVYGVQDGRPVAEDAPLRPLSPYGASKAACEALVSAWASQGLHVLASRSFAQIGPGQRPIYAVASWAAAIARAELRGGGVIEVGDVDVVRDYMHVRDAASAYVALAERGEPGTFTNVCSGTGRRLGDLLDRLIERSAVPVEVRRTRHRPADIPVLAGDNARLRALGWSPRHTLDDALDEMLAEQRALVGSSS